MGAIAIRPARDPDLPALTDIYNYYVLNTAITFDVAPFEPEGRRAWFEEHSRSGRHRLVVATDPTGAVLGYAATSRWRPKPAYETTVEASVYCRHDAVGQSIGRLLYEALFTSIADQDVQTIVAGVALPNEASIALHTRCGFQPVGVFTSVGRKFGRLWDVAWFQRPLKF